MHDAETGAAHVVNSQNTFCFLNLIPPSRSCLSHLDEESESQPSKDRSFMLCMQIDGNGFIY